MLRVGQQTYRIPITQITFHPIPNFLVRRGRPQLPFPDNTFDAVVSGFLMRNVIDLPRALSEQHRVLKPGGRIVILDTTRPRQSLLTPFVRFHMHTIIPLLGRLISGQDDAYEYLPDSSEAFLSAEAVSCQNGRCWISKDRLPSLEFWHDCHPLGCKMNANIGIQNTEKNSA